MTAIGLPLMRVTESLLLPAPQPSLQARASTPALALMADFLVTAASAIDASASLSEAKHAVRESGLSLLIVLQEPSCVLGVIDAKKLREEHALWPSPQIGSTQRELRVFDVVTRLSELEVMDLRTLAAATYAQVVEALERSDRDYLLVVETSSTATTGRLRGVVTRGQADMRTPAMP